MQVRAALDTRGGNAIDFAGPVFLVEKRLRELAQRHHDVYVTVLDAEHGEFLTLPEGCYELRRKP